MKLSHLALRISVLGTSLAFYEKLGFKQKSRVELEKFQTSLVFLESDNGLELELVYNWNKEGVPFLGDGFLHLGIEVDDLEGFLRYLEGFGIKPSQGVFTTPEGVKICFLQDPDGYQIELIER